MSVEPEKIIKLDKIILRPYQLPIHDAIENKGYKKVIAILPRRAGKDIASFLLAIRQCIKKICVVYYIFPTYALGKKIIWDSITNDGIRILSLIPDDIIQSKNAQEMKIRFVNGSLFQIIGSDNPDCIVGTNPYGCVFSEFAIQDPRAYALIRPILAANDGWALFVSTPRGKNHLWEMYNIALHSKDWFAYKMTVEETKHMTLQEIERERADGIMSEDLIQQEFYCSFELGVEGAYYTKYIDKMHLQNRIGDVPWLNNHRVNTAWDLGVRDSTAIIFFQVVGQTVRIIDYYENSKEGLEHYVNVVKSKPYLYNVHIAPFDIRVKEFGSGMTRLEKAQQLGINFTIAEELSIMDGIESVRSMFSKLWIDQNNCKKLINALENYRQEFDAKKKVYKCNPLHNWSSHACDAARYMAISLSKTAEETTPEELEKRYQETMYGSQQGGFYGNNSPRW